jgi:SNF2 family DNA or RNA helicase
MDKQHEASELRGMDIELQCESPQSFEVELTAEPEWVVSSPLGSFGIKTVGCLFAERGLQSGGVSVRSAQNGIGSASNRAPRTTHETDSERPCSKFPAPHSATRIRPPQDLVKLEDRLRLLLQPPLESLLAACSLRFAYLPFAHQLDGIAFLYPRHEAVLADEMGLGKTMQAITAVRLLVHHGYVRRSLLICPKPLILNWQREFSLWAPELTVTVIEGTPTRRQFLWSESGNVVTIANYEAVVRDRTDVCDPDNQFDLVMLDEAQRIKNASGTTHDVIRSITRHRSWALTGTPIENSIDDLVGIFGFVSPGCVDAKMKPRAIAHAVSDHVLRRTKDEVLTDLPPKLCRDADVELTAEQAKSYQLAEDEGVVRLREMKSAMTIQNVFELILRLKQICNFDPTTGTSSKLERLEADLEECAASGRKAIVFSQWVQTLTELGTRLARFKPVEYHGQIPHRRRESAIEQFRDDAHCHVLLMSYGAGSVGLNLQFASYVFLFDRWWNPAVEDQAINRAHRIGAAGPVTVTRFLAIDTIEQRINDILERKRELFDTVFGCSIAAPTCGLSRDEIFSLFDLDPQLDSGDAA